MTSDELGLLVAAARNAADDITNARDYRGKYAQVGRGLIYALAALATSLNKFADAITPKENHP